MFASIFPNQPQFRGRQVITFHNQRDYIFFRHHRYIHSLSSSVIYYCVNCFRYIFKNAKCVGMQELGPRFTLKLRSIQKGMFDSKYGEYIWLHEVCNVCHSDGTTYSSWDYECTSTLLGAMYVLVCISIIMSGLIISVCLRYTM